MEKRDGRKWLTVLLMSHFSAPFSERGGSGPSTAVFFSFSASPSSLFEAECMFTSSPRSLPLRLSSSLSLSIWYTQAAEWKEYGRHPEFAQSIPKEKNITVASALRGHRGSCQRPVCSRAVLHAPIMYCEQGGCTKHFNRTKIFYLLYLFSWWMSSTLTLCSHQRRQARLSTFIQRSS